MTRYRQNSSVVDAVQWFKNGDHPKVHPVCEPDDDDADLRCESCGKAHHLHGSIDNVSFRDVARVCPGNWMTESDCDDVIRIYTPEMFRLTFQLVTSSA